MTESAPARWWRKDLPPWALWLVLLVLLLLAASGVAQLVNPPVITETERDVKVVRRVQVDTSATERAELLEQEVARWKTLATKRTKRTQEPVAVVCDAGVPVIAYRTTEETDERAEAEGQRNASTSVRSTSTLASQTITNDTTEIHEKARVAPVLPSWRVSLAVGYSFTRPALTLQGGLTLGLDVTFRVPFPLPPQYSVWLGAGASTVGELRGVAAVQF